MIKRAEYLEQIRPFIGKDVVKVLTGMRRSGKSTLLEQISKELSSMGIAPENIILMNFESARFGHLLDSPMLFHKEIMQISKGKKGRLYLLFDEMQMVSSWEKVIGSLRVDLDCDIYITGSNANLLAGELATLLAGRYVSFEILPFSFLEIREALPELEQNEAFALFRTIGGLPFLSQIGFARNESLIYLSDIFNSIVLKDVAQRKGFRDIDQLERVLRYFISEIGTTFSVKNISNIFESEKRSVSRESIYNYLKAAEEAMLFSRVKRYDIRGREILRGNEKIYLTDIGLREALFGNNAARVDLILENIVFNELKRRGYHLTVGKNDTREIDFVARKGAATLYVQVTYLLAHEETVKREFGAFSGIGDNFPRLVISMDTVDFSQNGIRHMNIVEFLTSKHY